MADPVVTAIPAGAWTKIATNVTAGFVRLLDKNKDYLYTQRDTGGAAPTVKTEGAVFEGLSMQISASAGIDVYIWAQQGGSVRVDL